MAEAKAVKPEKKAPVLGKPQDLTGPPMEKPVAMTERQIKINNFVNADSNSAIPTLSDVTDVIESDTRIEMSIPKGVARPEFSYMWLPIDAMEKYLYSQGGLYVLVTRSNHSHVPDHMFGLDGGITYHGQNILGFCRREITDTIQDRVIQSYNRKAHDARDDIENHHGAGIRVESTDGKHEGGVREAQELTTDESYETFPEDANK